MSKLDEMYGLKYIKLGAHFYAIKCAKHDHLIKFLNCIRNTI